MPKTTARSVHRFPHYPQIGDMACGIACLRMLEEWLTEAAHSEKHWHEQLENSGCLTGDRRLRDSCIRRQILAIEPRCVVEVINKKDWKDVPKAWRDASRGSEEVKCVYLLRIDCFVDHGENAVKNPHHYIIVHRFFGYNKSIDVAMYNCTQDGSGALWAWPSILEARVHKIFKISKPSA